MRIAMMAPLAVGLTMPAAAPAALIERSFTFSATNFDKPGPVDPVIGSFTVSFDNTTDVDPGNIMAVPSLNLPETFFYFRYIKQNDEIVIADRIGFGANKCGVLAKEQNFCFLVTKVSTSPVYSTFFYSDGKGIYTSHTITATTITPPQPAIPEPATWAMMIAGFGVVGGALRRRATTRFA